MSGPESTSGTTGAYEPQHPALRWLEKRLPISRLIHAEFVAYPTPLGATADLLLLRILPGCAADTRTL
jgi:hypothetical protein